MTVRLNDPPLHDTEKLLGLILAPILTQQKQVLFLCPAGQGVAVLQRLRVMISRNRKKLIRKGKKPKQFRLHSTIHPETHNGLRYDACVCWHTVSDSNMMTEILEDVMSYD